MKISLFPVAQTTSKSLALFRVLYCFVLFLELTLLIYFKELFFKHKFISTVLLSLDVLCVIFILVGFLTKVASIFNYLFWVAILYLLGNQRYALDNSIIIANFLLVFFPISDYLSFDSVIKPKSRTLIPTYYPVLFFILIHFVSKIIFDTKFKYLR